MRGVALSSLLLLFTAIACRGREYLSALPRTGQVTGGVVALVAASEAPVSTPRAVVIQPESGEASELNLVANAPLKETYRETVLQLAQFVVSRDGKVSSLSPEPEKRSGSFHACTQSPRREHVACLTATGLSFMNAATGERVLRRGAYRSCAWRSPKKFICLEGEYNKENHIVELDAAADKAVVLVRKNGERITGLAANGATGSFAYATGKDAAWRFWRNTKGSGNAESVGDLTGYYIFDTRISAQGVVAARIASALRSDDKLVPRNIWVSHEFGGRKGVLLDLAELPAPGFFSGAGFEGVESFDFSPDGEVLAILMSGQNDCRMVDEGGNVACRMNIHIFDSRTRELKQLTHFRATELRSVRWFGPPPID